MKPPLAQAKYATARSQAPTLGGVVGYLSKAIRGKTLMPWQQQVANVACELSTEFPGEFRYKTVIITVPRQAGKSDLLGAIHTHRLVAYRKNLAVMTAQTGRDAGKRWRNIVSDIPEADLARFFKVNRGKGSEYVSYLPTGSQLSPFAPTPNAVHGDALAMASIDEAWAFTQMQGMEIEGAIRPTFLTVPNSQLWIVSTRGTANSAWLNEKIEIGRASVKDPASRIAYFEWSADEQHAEQDPYSDETLSFHPAIGHTQTARRIRDLGAGKDVSLSEWRRAYLNLATETTETAFDLALWDSRRWNYELPDTKEKREIPASATDMVLAFDVAIDGSSATIAVGWLDEENNPAVQIAATAPGTTWLRGYLTAAARKGYRAIVTDDTGANAVVVSDLMSDVPVQPFSFREYRHANQSFQDRLREGNITHDGNALVREQIGHAVLRNSVSGRVIDAAKSAGAVDALRAIVLAQHVAALELSATVIQIF